MSLPPRVTVVTGPVVRVTQATGAAHVTSIGVRGLPGAASSSYHHIQGVASTTWTINHNLGFNPNVSTFDVGGDQFEGDVEHVDLNTTLVHLAYAISGTANLS